MNDPEWNLFGLARAGYQNAWQTLIDKHYPRLVNLAFLITGSRETACDVAQETFLRMIEGTSKHSDGTVSGYLSTIAFHCALKWKQQERKSISLDGLESIQSLASNPIEQTITNERETFITRAISELDSDERNVLVLRFYGDLSYDEIANVLGIPLGTVKSRLFRAVSKSRELLRKMGVRP